MDRRNLALLMFLCSNGLRGFCRPFIRCCLDAGGRGRCSGYARSHARDAWTRFLRIGRGFQGQVPGFDLGLAGARPSRAMVSAAGGTGFQPFRFFGARFPGPLARAGMRSRLGRSEIGVFRTVVGSTENRPTDVAMQQWVALFLPYAKTLLFKGLKAFITEVSQCTLEVIRGMRGREFRNWPGFLGAGPGI